MKNSSNILLGILGAAAAGVLIGMIVAPKKGSALRSDLKSSANGVARKLERMLSKGQKKYDELRSRVEDERENLKKTSREFAAEAGGAYNKAEEAYDDFTNGAAKAYKKIKS